MACDKIKAVTYDSLSGELSREEDKKLRLHLQDCPACRKYYSEIEAIIKEIQRMEATHPSPEVCLKTLEKIERRRPFKLAAALPRPALAITAGLILIVTSALLYYLWPGSRIEMEERSSTIAHKQLADADMDKLRKEYLEESDFILTMILYINKGEIPYSIDDIKRRIVAKDLRYAGSVIIASKAGDQKLCQEINSILKDIMRIKDRGEEREVRSIVRSIKRSQLLERIAEERNR